jgi:hypothetical protein
MANNLFSKTFIAGAAIAAYRIVKPGSDDDHVVQGAAASDYLIGVADNLGAGTGERVGIVFSGIAEVEFAGVVTRGQFVTADSNGKGVNAGPAAGTNNRIIGIALNTTAAGDIAPVLLTQGSVQG